jgi:hypothetical protein
VLGSADTLAPSQKWQAAETILMLADVKGNDRRLEVFIEGKVTATERFYLDVSPRGRSEVKTLLSRRSVSPSSPSWR